MKSANVIHHCNHGMFRVNCPDIPLVYMENDISTGESAINLYFHKGILKFTV